LLGEQQAPPIGRTRLIPTVVCALWVVAARLGRAVSGHVGVPGTAAVKGLPLRWRQQGCGAGSGGPCRRGDPQVVTGRCACVLASCCGLAVRGLTGAPRLGRIGAAPTAEKETEEKAGQCK